MRDDTHRWPAPKAPSERIDAAGVTISHLAVDRLTLISGNKVRQSHLPLVEWPNVAKGARYAVSLRRDRILEVNGAIRPEGWDATSQTAISDVTDGYAQVALSGPNAFDLIRRGTEIDPRIPSKSAARLFFGLGVFLYRYDDEQTYRIHVASGQGEALWQALKDAATHLGS